MYRNSLREIPIIKILFVLANLLLLIISLAGLINSRTNINREKITVANIVFFALSIEFIVITILLCFWSWLANIKQILQPLKFHLGLAILFVIAFLIIGIITSRRNAGEDVRNLLEKHWEDELNGEENRAMNATQFYFQCCGVMGPSDYLEKKLKYPPSCYSPVRNTYQSVIEKILTNLLYKKGCYDVMKPIYEKEYSTLKIFPWMSFCAAIVLALCSADLIYVLLKEEKNQEPPKEQQIQA